MKWRSVVLAIVAFQLADARRDATLSFGYHKVLAASDAVSRKTRPAQLELVKVGVIVRTYNPAPGMLARMKSYVEELKSHAPKIELLLSIDTSKVNRAQEIQQAVPGANYHVYNWQQIVKRHKILDVLAPPKGSSRPPSPYNFHQEPVHAAAQWLAAKAPANQAAHYWVLEDDVFLCGSLLKLIEQYEDDPADFLSLDIKRIEDWSKWNHTHEATPAFENLERTERWNAPEWVQRFSMKFLNYLDEISMNSNVSAQSEMFAPTICMTSKARFTCKTMADNKGRAECGGVVADNEADAQKICAAADPAKTTINHAAKY